jgi:hypothetical protein
MGVSKLPAEQIDTARDGIQDTPIPVLQTNRFD